MERLQQHWYRVSPLHLLLYPLSLIFRLLAALRRGMFRFGLLASVKLPVPVIVIGNITVGGTGKTPLTLWLAQQLIAAGWQPAIISRGYRSEGDTSARAVRKDDSANQVGDEPLLMARRALCPVWIGRDRPAAALALLHAHPECDVIISDDGLQHYRLQRDVEIAVIDGIRRFGNGMLLPAGPLREPVSRLLEVDAVVINGGSPDTEDGVLMSLHGTQFRNLLDPTQTRSAADFDGLHVHAIAGIGHPDRFFRHLQQLGLQPDTHAFPDHHRYTGEEITPQHADAILMTEKDAVKCAAFATNKHWVLQVEAQVAPPLFNLITEKLSHGR
ncbi:MAG: tetraacyldisaccharide 4'-kinase [Gammaproteobacteria bacterium]|nr:tetraacyldisaccharide 4'-kinase [Gammaproteobacteria bacterium]MBU1624969.1 tetraacyldisaccharide 4'-kinase [Gammaproteobacteria bacterium]MBU1981229.1 tetraacyldisaccharide 4'-kinase [Gammaproteobacteria bacterium]